MKDTLTIYAEFIQFREAFITAANNKATHFEKRPDGICRPMVMIRTDAEYRQIAKDIAHWQLVAKELVERDPARFSATSTMLSPEPRLFTNVASVALWKTHATSTRKVTKDALMKRLHKKIMAMLVANRGVISERIKQIQKEFNDISKDPETTYRIRSERFSDFIAEVNEKDGTKTRFHVPMAGFFVYDPNKRVTVSISEGAVRSPRSDSFEQLGIEPVPCSIDIGGVVVRESDRVNKLAQWRSKNGIYSEEATSNG